MRYKEIACKVRGKIPGEWIPCEVCGGTAVEFHHVLGRRGSLLNDPNNLIAVCRGCHTDIHSHNTAEMREKLLSIIKNILGKYE